MKPLTGWALALGMVLAWVYVVAGFFWHHWHPQPQPVPTIACRIEKPVTREWRARQTPQGPVCDFDDLNDFRFSLNY